MEWKPNFLMTRTQLMNRLKSSHLSWHVWQHAATRVMDPGKLKRCCQIDSFKCCSHYVAVAQFHCSSRTIPLVRKPEGKRLVRRLRNRWEDNIKINLKKIKCDNVDWFHLSSNWEQGQILVNSVMKLWVPYRAGNFLTIWTTINFSKILLCGVCCFSCFIYTVEVNNPIIMNNTKSHNDWFTVAS
jgi:hypothetical protein